MNITLYATQDFETNNELHTFKIELDGLTEAEYLQKCQAGLFRYSKTGIVISSKCAKCGNVIIDGVPSVCLECGSIQFSHKQTNDTWALCDADGVPEQFIGKTDLLPAFWAFNAFLTDNQDLGQAEIEQLLESSANFDDIDDHVYQVQYLTDSEVNEEFSELHDNIFPDINQDWPVEENNEIFNGYRTFNPPHIANEGYNF
jgi:predicted  nucleic acid-binding Zn-ribbon protein